MTNFYLYFSCILMKGTFNATMKKFKPNSNYPYSNREKQGRITGMLLDSLHKQAEVGDDEDEKDFSPQ